MSILKYRPEWMIPMGTDCPPAEVLNQCCQNNTLWLHSGLKSTMNTQSRIFGRKKCIIIESGEKLYDQEGPIKAEFS